jgi:hypothetical protein
MCTDGQKDKHHEANSRSSQFFLKATEKDVSNKLDGDWSCGQTDKHSLWVHRSVLLREENTIFILVINQLDAQSSLNLCTGRPPIGVMIPEAV